MAPLESGSSVRSLVVRGGALVTTLLIVRHPFDRLVSAYLDKIVSSESKYHERAKIRQKYHIKQITFQHFLNYVVGQFKKFKSSDLVSQSDDPFLA